MEIGAGCDLASHVAIEGPTKIGAENHFFPFTSIGLAPQDIGYAGEPTRLEIGDHNKIREFVTINRGTVKGGGATNSSEEDLRRIIRDAGFMPVQRDPLYRTMFVN